MRLDSDTVCGIMTPKRLEQLKRELSELRRRNSVKPKELEQFAKKVGRTKSNRGKEPTYVIPTMPERRPLSIPHHNRDLAIGTKNNIVDSLERDLLAYEEAFDKSIAPRNAKTKSVED